MKKHLFTLLTIILCFSINTQAQDLSFKNINGFKVEKWDGKNLVIRFTMTVQNTTSKGFGLTVKKGQFFKDGELYGTFKLLKKIKITNKASDNLDIQAQITLNKDWDLTKDGLSMLMGKQVKVELKGILKATWFIFWKKYPFELDENISVKKLLGK